MTVIFDYGAGNLRSVENTLAAIGEPFTIVNDSRSLLKADKIILPGVGHYGQLLRSLDALGVRETFRERIASGIPFLGICLGFQALFETSDEAPEQGLAVFAGRVTRFPADTRAPQMGWNSLQQQGGSRLLANLGDNPYVYFANSYYVPSDAAGERAAALCSYSGTTFCAAIEDDNVFAVQFHPEKSGPVGQQIVRNFLAC